MSGRRQRALLGPALAALCLALAHAAGATTVTTTADDGAGSLREAIGIVNGNPDDDLIDFLLPPLEGDTISLEAALPDLLDDVTIDGTPPTEAGGTVTIDATLFQVLALDGVDATVIDVEIDGGTIGIGDDDILTFTANDNFGVDATISDLNVSAAGGEIVKDGDATLTLDGVNTGFTGKFTVEAGTLIGNFLSLPGDITTNATVIFDEPLDIAQHMGDIDGTGALQKAGAGQLTLMGENSYSGGTTISEGSLIGDARDPGDPMDLGSIQGNIEITDADAELVLVQNGAPGQLDGDISGEGSLVKRGAMDVTLTGNNSYTGGTTVELGTLVGDTDAIQGDVELETGTLLAFDQSGSGSHSGAISGPGALEKRGIGSVSLSGNNTYEGGTTVLAGTLIVNTSSLPQTGGTTVNAPGTLAFDQGSNGIFGDVISGDGDLEKGGSGRLKLTAVNTISGTTTITGGALDLEGSVAGDVIVASGGTLTGEGPASVGGDLTVRGVVSPDDSNPGTFGDRLEIAGAATYAGPSRLVIDMDETSMADSFVADSVTIEPGATLEILPMPGQYAVDSTADVVVAGGGITGSFDPGEPFAFLDRTIVTDANAITVTLVRNAAGIGDVPGITENQRSVGDAIAPLNGDPAFNRLFENLITLTVSEVGPALDALGGEQISGFTTARLAMGERLQRTLHRRMRSVLFSSEKAWPSFAPGLQPRPRSSLGPPAVSLAGEPGDNGIGPWVDGYGVFGQLDGDRNSSDVDYDVYGTTAGVDFRIGENWLAGFAAGYARTHVELQQRSGDGDANSAQAGAYAAYATPLLFAGLSGRYAWSNADNKRRIDIGTISESAKGEWDSHDFGVRGELAVNAYEWRDVRLQPLAGIEYSHLSREDFKETGAGSLGLRVDDEDLDSALAQLGARVEMVIPLQEDAVMTPVLRGFWLYEFGDRDRLVRASIGGSPFDVKGAEAPRSSGLIGAGWAVTIGSNVRAIADYDARIDGDRVEHVGQLTVHVRF